MCQHKKFTEGCWDCQYRYLTVKSHSHKPQLDFKGKARNKRYFGIELEVECQDETHQVLNAIKEVITDCWDFKHDGSLNDGIEFVSQPVTHSRWVQGVGDNNYLNWIKKLPKTCKSHDTTTCGLHIHVNRDSLTDDGVLKLNYFLNKYYEKFEKLGRRKVGGYCQRDMCYQFNDNPYNGRWELVRKFCQSAS